MKMFFIFFLYLSSFCLQAQSLDIKNKKLSFSLGAFDHTIEKMQNLQNLDFLNYADSTPEFFDEAIIKFGYRFDFLEKLSADIKIIMSNLVPDNYDISTYYAIDNRFSIGLGSYLNKFYITGFELFQLQSLPDYYLVDNNQQQIKAYDLGIYLSPTIKIIENKRFQTNLKLDIGFSSFMKENIVFHHKKKLSNERLIYIYNTRITAQPYLNPKLEMSLRAFSINKTSVGFFLNSNFYYSKRSINYNRVIQKWISSNDMSEYVKMPKHSYTRFETNFGIYATW